MSLPDLELEGGEKGGTEWFKCSLDLLMEKSKSCSAIREKVEREKGRGTGGLKGKNERSVWEQKDRNEATYHMVSIYPMILLMHKTRI